MEFQTLEYLEKFENVPFRTLHFFNFLSIFRFHESGVFFKVFGKNSGNEGMKTHVGDNSNKKSTHISRQIYGIIFITEFLSQKNVLV